MGPICSTSGTLSYETFDGALLSYTGACRYKLAGSKSKSLTQFGVYIQNKRMKKTARGHPVQVKHVDVEYNNKKIRLLSNMRVLVSDCRIYV